MNMHHSFSIKPLLLALMLLALPVAVRAQAAAINDQALVTIRFNQPRIYYDQQLYSAISKAISVKSSVMFEVISYAPLTGNAEIDAKWQQLASQHAQAVVASMQKMGVPASRMTVTGEFVEGLKFDEVHVLVH